MGSKKRIQQNGRNISDAFDGQDALMVLDNSISGSTRSTPPRNSLRKAAPTAPAMAIIVASIGSLRNPIHPSISIKHFQSKWRLLLDAKTFPTWENLQYRHETIRGILGSIAQPPII
ncbi:MAG: hypothetical protein L6R37_005129 [Teloschistes peruensis]|nr:MAG: hypothetical protein L6R37_005129 [Teloschistes peruensis]